MDMRIIIASFMLSLIHADDNHYRTSLLSQKAFDDQNGEKSENFGFVQPIDFGSFTQQFFSDSSSPSSLPFSNSGGFDFFGSESKSNNFFQSPKGGLAFPESALSDGDSTDETGFVKPIEFRSLFDGEASPSTVIYQPNYAPRPRNSNQQNQHNNYRSQAPNLKLFKTTSQGKSNYPSPRPGQKSEHLSPVISDTADVEVFLPRGQLILPTKDGRPKPYDGYRAATDVRGRVHSDGYYYPKRTPQRNSGQKNPYYGRTQERGVQQFVPQYEEDKEEEVEESRNRRLNNEDREEVEDVSDDGESEEDETPPRGKGLGYKYQYDSTVNVPDLIIKKYPYEKEFEDDFPSSYEAYKDSFPNLEKIYGGPNYEEYNSASTKSLAKNSNCKQNEEKADKNLGEICYVCSNPDTGSTYEQCAYQNEPTSKNYYYGSSKSSSNDKPRNKRSLDLYKPSNFDYIIFNDSPNFQTQRKVRENSHFYERYENTFPKRKSKKYVPLKPKKYLTHKNKDFKHPGYTYEGPSESYEGPKFSYEGPLKSYEGPDHDDYYDKTDDRIPHSDNPPLYSSFLDVLYHKEKGNDKNRPRRKPEAFQNFGMGNSYLDGYRFGPEYFEEFDSGEKHEQSKRDTNELKNDEKLDTKPKEVSTSKITVFKNGDVCEKTRKDGMVCMVCSNEKSGATYEQCQYSTKPTGNKYKYGHQTSSFTSSKSRPQRHAKSDQFPALSNKIERKVVVTKTEKHIFGDDEEKVEKLKKKHDLTPSATYEVEDKSESEPGSTVDIESIHSIEGVKKKDEEDDHFPNFAESYEEYLKRVFPEFEEFAGYEYEPFSDLEQFQEEEASDDNEELNYEDDVEEESHPATVKQNLTGNVTEDKSREAIEKAFGEFQNRDWSKCERTLKEKLVCYNCIGADGTSNEECMFVEGLDDASSEKTDTVQNETEAIVKNDTVNSPTSKVTKFQPIIVLPVEIIPAKNQKGDFENVERPSETTVYSEEKVNSRKNKLRKFKKYFSTEEPEVTPLTWESSKTDGKEENSYITSTEGNVTV